jgi:addiction module RelE/StbE family toxin
MQSSWTTRATKNLDDIEHYIAHDDPRAAYEVTSKILTTIRHLATHPHLGRAGRIYGTRELIIPELAYIVPYRVKNNQIQILRILHTSMRWPNSV